jgi:XTP/dITP diphosphohydrolase
VILLIIATRNAHKVREIRALLASQQFSYRTLNDFPSVPAVIEDAETFTGNASKKAVQLASWLAAHPQTLAGSAAGNTAEEVYCLADDSGLEVDALHGAPGVHSARFAALDTGSSGNSSDQANNAKLLRLLSDLPPAARTARFRCVIALTPVVLTDPAAASSVCYADEAELRTQVFEGTCEGRINETPRGQHGFGYDPLFIPNGFTESFGELGEEVKNRISHRAKVLQKVKSWFSRQR